MKRLTTALIVACLGFGFLVATAAPATAAPAVETAVQPPAEPANCSTDFAIDRTLQSGNAWNMCWRVDNKRGLILADVAFQSRHDDAPIGVIDEIGVAQLNVPYDIGGTVYNDITEYGFGGGYLQPMSTVECPDGEIIDLAGRSGAGRPALCVTEERSGVAHRLWDGQYWAAQGTDLVVSMISKVGWYEYITEYRLHDDGEINVRLGATGDLSPGEYTNNPNGGWPIGGPGDVNTYASNHFHSVFFKVDFGIGEGEQKVQELTVQRAGDVWGNPQLVSTMTDVSTERKEFVDSHGGFRVLNPTSLNADGHARSYDIVMTPEQAYNQNPQTDYDVAFTQSKANEIYASQNRWLAVGGELDEVTQFVADEQQLTDPVAWVNVGFHHVVRDEDQSPMPIHWQGFTLYPRDFTAQSPNIPDGRLQVNGNPAPDGDGGGPQPNFPPRVQPGGGGGYEALPVESPIPDELGSDVNLALYASAHVDGYYDINSPDANGPQNLNDGDFTTFWDGDHGSTPSVITYRWSDFVTVGRADVAWGSWGVYNRPPASWQIEYLAPGGVWKPVELTSGEYSNSAFTFGEPVVASELTFEPVETNSLRISATRSDGALMAWGWDVFQPAGAEPTPEPTETGQPSPQPTETSAPSPEPTVDPEATPPPATPGTVAIVATDPVAVGAQQGVSASGFEPGEAVTAVMYSDPTTIGTYLAGDNGSVSFSFAVPDVGAGKHELVITGQRSGSVARVSFAVVERGGIAAILADTGMKGAPVQLLGVGLIAIAAGALVLARVRRRRDTSALLT